MCPPSAPLLFFLFFFFFDARAPTHALPPAPPRAPSRAEAGAGVGGCAGGGGSDGWWGQWRPRPRGRGATLVVQRRRQRRAAGSRAGAPAVVAAVPSFHSAPATLQPPLRCLLVPPPPPPCGSPRGQPPSPTTPVPAPGRWVGGEGHASYAVPVAVGSRGTGHGPPKPTAQWRDEVQSKRRVMFRGSKGRGTEKEKGTGRVGLPTPPSLPPRPPRRTPCRGVPNVGSTVPPSASATECLSRRKEG